MGFNESLEVRHPRAGGDPGFENTSRISAELDDRLRGHDGGGTFVSHPFMQFRLKNALRLDFLSGIRPNTVRRPLMR